MKTNNFFTFLKGVFLIQVFLVVIIVGIGSDLYNRNLQICSYLRYENLFLPFKQININENEATLLFQEANLLLSGNNKLHISIAGENFASSLPENILGSHIQALAYITKTVDEEALTDKKDTTDIVEPPAIMMEIEQSPDEEMPDQSALRVVNSTFFKEKEIIVYCTHSAESYIPDSGRARLDGERGLVNNVAVELVRSLEEKGLKAEFIDKIHDYPEYNKSYTNSRKTVNNIIKSNRDIAAIIDLHRDSIPGINSARTVKFNNKKAACILIIVGTDQRKPHPHWKKNLAFAEQLHMQGEKLYPGLIKGVRTKAGTYNQEFHKNALLIEIGTDHNTLEEAKYAAKLYSDVLIEALKEEIP